MIRVGDHLYTAKGNKGLVMYSLKVPLALEKFGEYRFGDEVLFVKFDGTFMNLIFSNYEIIPIDVRNPLLPLSATPLWS